MSYPIAAEINTPTTGDDTCLVTPESYIIEVHEMGLCNTNPIQSQNWVKSGNVVLWTKGTGAALTADVAPGKSISNPPVVQPPPLGSYNYSYVLLKNEITQKAKAVFLDATFYSTDTLDASGTEAAYASYTESLTNFAPGGFSPYINETAFKTEGLLLQSDKATTSTAPGVTPYILGVFDLSNKPLIVPNAVRSGQQLGIKFRTTNRVGIWCDDWSAPGPATNFTFGSLPFVFRVTIS